LLSAQYAARLYGLYLIDDYSCDLIRMDPNTGDNITLASGFDVCANVTGATLRPSFTHRADGELIVAISSVPSLYAIDLATQKERIYSTLDKYDSSDPWMGLGVVYTEDRGTAVYLVSQFSVWNVTTGKAVKIATISLPAEVIVAAAPPDTAFESGRLFFADMNSGSVFTMDLSAPATPLTHITSDIDGAMDFQYSRSANTFIELASYKLYSTNPTTGSSTQLINIPNGPGFPFYNTISPDGDVFVYYDLAQAHVVDLPNKSITNNWEFVLASRGVGFPCWVPT